MRWENLPKVTVTDGGKCCFAVLCSPPPPQPGYSHADQLTFRRHAITHENDAHDDDDDNVDDGWEYL